MLIHFALENFMSVAAEAQIDLRLGLRLGPTQTCRLAGSPGDLGPASVLLPDGTQALTRVLVVGPNAAGKTVLLKGLGQLRTLALAGTRPGQPLALSPCRFLASGKPGIEDRPTKFALTLFADGALWTYRLSATRELIEAESLHRTVGAAGEAEGLSESVFTRRRESPLIPATAIKIGDGALGERERLQLCAQATRAEQPFLCEALRRGTQVMAPVGAWLRERLQLVRAEAKIVGLGARCAREPAFARFLGDLLAQAGTGVSEVTASRTRVDPDYFETEEEKQQVVAALTGYSDGFVQTNDGEIIAEQDGRLVDLYLCRLRVRGHGRGGAVDLPLGDLSDGILRLLHLSPVLYGHGRAALPQVYFVDELDRSLHPRVVGQLLCRFAAAPPTPAGPHGHAQLIATTHDAVQLSAVHPAELRLCVRDPDTRIGPPSPGLAGDELTRRFVSGTLVPAE
jgi:hypothetical protein